MGFIAGMDLPSLFLPAHNDHCSFVYRKTLLGPRPKPHLKFACKSPIYKSANLEIADLQVKMAGSLQV